MSTQSPFTQAYLAALDGPVRVKDAEGRRGEVVAISDGDPATRSPGDALVVWDRGGATRFTADRFNARLQVIVQR
jgi:hypothetical protein